MCSLKAFIVWIFTHITTYVFCYLWITTYVSAGCRNWEGTCQKTFHPPCIPVSMAYPFIWWSNMSSWHLLIKSPLLYADRDSQIPSKITRDVYMTILFLYLSFNIFSSQGKWFWRWQSFVSFPRAWTFHPKMLQFPRIYQWQWAKTCSRSWAEAYKDNVSHTWSLCIWRSHPCWLQSHQQKWRIP